MNFRFRKISLTDALNIYLQPEIFFTGQSFLWQIMRENSEIHAKLGFEKTETLYARIDKWELSFSPDKITGDGIYECKIVRPYSNREKLKEYAYYQALIEAYLLQKSQFTLVFYNYKEQKIEEEQNYFLGEEEKFKAETFLKSLILRLERLREIFIKGDTSELA
jgi:hypothetical protein